MDDIKINVTISLPGRQLYNVESEDTTSPNIHKYKGEVIKYFTRKSVPASQNINMTKEAYNYMTSSNCPHWEKPKEWKNMSKKDRLESHMRRTALDLGGTLIEYTVFND